MTKIIVQVKGHYEVHETPFSRAYDWYPACVVLECDCGEKLALTGSSTVAACRQCGVNHSSVFQEIQAREGRLQHETTHPWYYDLQSQADQHLRDEVAYPEQDSPWRYNDITSGVGDDKERWKKTTA
jgi:hypothetical protein